MTKNKSYAEVKKLIDCLINKCSHGEHIFRGINRIYKGEKEISSSLFREHEKDQVWNMYFSPKQAEREIIEKAKRLFPPNTSNVEILTDLRHYGGKVNFIDFTFDLYVALFFACNGTMKQDGQLVILKSDDLYLLGEDEDINYEKNDNTVVLVRPIKTSISWNRAIVQKSIFVYPPLGYIPKNQCIIIEIKRKYKPGILEYLKKFHDISSDTIYNDLIGFINNEKNYSSALIEFYKIIALMKKAELQINIENKTEKYEEVINAFDKFIKLNPYNANYYHNRGVAKMELGQYKEAIIDYNRAIELNPSYTIAYNSRGIARSQLGYHEKAVEDCNKAIELNSHYGDAYNNRGIIKSKLGYHEKAIEDCSKAIELKPHYANAYNSRGIAKMQLGQYKEVIIDCSRAIELKPHYAGAYNNRGIAKSKLGHHEKAIEDYNEAIELKPRDASFYNSRGIAKMQLGHHEKAIEDYNKAIELKPRDASFYNSRGIAKMQLGHHEKAIEDYNKAIELKPDYAQAYHNRGNAKTKLDQYNEAILDLEKAVELDFKLESKLRPIINKLKNKLKS